MDYSHHFLSWMTLRKQNTEMKYCAQCGQNYPDITPSGNPPKNACIALFTFLLAWSHYRTYYALAMQYSIHLPQSLQCKEFD